jgi:hypothetical protein
MRSRSVFQTPFPGIALNQKRLLCERGILAYDIVINEIQWPVEYGRMLPKVFHSFSFPLCEPVVPSY